MSKLKSMLIHVAPTLASALGGPFAGVATKFLADKLGVEETPESLPLEGLLTTLLDDKENLKKVQELDGQFQLEMQKLNVDVFDLEVDDRKNARDLATVDMRPHVVLSFAFIVVYFIMLGFIFWAEISPDFNPGMAYQPELKDANGTVVEQGKWVAQNESLIDLFKILLGVLTAGVGQVLNFWFGGRNIAGHESPRIGGS